jgi:hypothetical protein
VLLMQLMLLLLGASRAWIVSLILCLSWPTKS